MKKKWQVFTPSTLIEFDYEGEHREGIFKGIDFGSNERYPEPQFFLRCIALDRDGAERSFAIAKIQNIKKTDMSW